MPIDPTIIGRLQVPQMDPLGTIGKANQVGQGILQNRLLQQEVEGKLAEGRAAQSAIDKVTGQFDPDAFMKGLAADPLGAQRAPAAAVTAQQQRKAQIDAQVAELTRKREELGLTEAQGKVISGGLLPFIEQSSRKDAQGNPVAPTVEGFQNALINIITQLGPAADQNVVGRARALLDAAKQDPTKIMDLATGAVLLGNPSAETVNLLKGPVSTVDTAGRTVQQQISPLTSEVNTIGAVEKERSPTERAALVPVYDPATGKTEMKRSGEIMGDDPTGQKPVAIQSAPALGEAEAGSAAVQQASSLRAAADKVPEQQAALKNIRDVVDNFKPGAKTNWIYAANALATQMGLGSKEFKERIKTETAAQEEFNKLATQFVNQQMGALGGSGTDSKLESAARGTPNEFMSKEGIKGVTSLMMGLNDATAAKNRAWQAWLASGKPAASYDRFATQFNEIYNPRVFQSVYMDEKQRANMLKNMTPDDRKQFQKDWTTAKRFGWIK